MKQETIKSPKSARIIDIVLGAITLSLGAFVLVYPTFAASLLIVFLSIALLFAGLEGLILGAAAKSLSGSRRALRVIAGLIAIGLSIAVIAFPLATLATAAWLLSLAFMVIGALSIAKGASEKFMAGWARTMYIVTGCIAIGLSIPMIVYPGVSLVTLWALMATILIVNGTAYIIAGITGAVYVPVGMNSLRKSRDWESEAA